MVYIFIDIMTKIPKFVEDIANKLLDSLGRGVSAHETIKGLSINLGGKKGK